MSDVVVFSPGEALPPPREPVPSPLAWRTGDRWLKGYADDSDTRAAYERDVLRTPVDRPCGPRWTLEPAAHASPAPFFEWCRAVDVDPLAITPLHVRLWLRWLDGFYLAPATVARKVSTLRTFYRFAKDEDGVVDSIPVPDNNRPLRLTPVPRESTTRGLTEDEVKAMRLAARDRSLRDAAILALLYHQGLRVSELIRLNVSDVRGFDRGHRTISVHGKGGKRRTLVLAPSAAHEVDAYIADRAHGAEVARADDLHAATRPLFPPTLPKHDRLSRRQVDHVVAACARAAGIEGTVTPHVLRHACITHMRDRGQGIADVQEHAGHSSPDTTQRYDRRRHSLDRSPAYVLPSPDA